LRGMVHFEPEQLIAVRLRRKKKFGKTCLVPSKHEVGSAPCELSESAEIPILDKSGVPVIYAETSWDARKPDGLHANKSVWEEFWSVQIRYQISSATHLVSVKSSTTGDALRFA
jgi:hypothetical protein